MDVRVHDDKLLMIAVLDQEAPRDRDDVIMATETDAHSGQKEVKSAAEPRTKDKIGIEIDYLPYLWVQWPEDIPEDKISDFAAHVNLFAPTDREDPYLAGCRVDRKADPTQFRILRSELDPRTEVAGYRDGKKTKCVRLLCSSESARRYYAARFRSTTIQEHVFKVFNDEFDTRLQFLAEQKLTIAGWCRIDRFTLVEEDEDFAAGNPGAGPVFRTLQHELRCQAAVVTPFARDDAPLVRAAFDIETISGTSSKEFGFALNRHDLCIVISVFIQKTPTTPEKTYVFMLGVTHSNEKEMLDDFAYLLTQVDVLYSYNGNLYDVPYLMGRADVTKSQLRHLSPIRKHDIFQTYHRRKWLLDPKKGVSAFDLPGWWHIDLYRLVMRKEIEAKLGNKLKQVLAHLFPDSSDLQKIDVKAQDIRPLFLDLPEGRESLRRKYANPQDTSPFSGRLLLYRYVVCDELVHRRWMSVQVC